jgi:hypothetical protein
MSPVGEELRGAALAGDAGRVAKALTGNPSELETNWALAWASIRGHAEVAKLICAASPAQLDVNWGMAWAAYGGHEDLVRMFLALGATARHWARHEARAGGHPAIAGMLTRD